MAEHGDWRSLYPFESRWLELPGARMHYVDEGGGPPMLMVHGNPTWSFFWRGLVAGLRGTQRAIAVDHIGCGLSEKPQDYPYSLAQHSDNLVALIDHLDLQQFTLIVHDWGGAIGLGAALRRASRVGRIILFNTGAFPPPYVPLRIRLCRTPWLGTSAIRGLNLFARAALTMAVNERSLDSAIKRGLLHPYDSWDNRIAIDQFVRDIPFSRRHGTWAELERIEQGLPQLAHLPTAMIWGMQDWCFRPECLQRLHASFPDADVHQLPQAGHYVLEDAPETCLQYVRDFLARHPLPSSNAAASPE